MSDKYQASYELGRMWGAMGEFAADLIAIAGIDNPEIMAQRVNEVAGLVALTVSESRKRVEA